MRRWHGWSTVSGRHDTPSPSDDDTRGSGLARGPSHRGGVTPSVEMLVVGAAVACTGWPTSSTTDQHAVDGIVRHVVNLGIDIFVVVPGEGKMPKLHALRLRCGYKSYYVTIVIFFPLPKTCMLVNFVSRWGNRSWINSSFWWHDTKLPMLSQILFEPLRET